MPFKVSPLQGPEQLRVWKSPFDGFYWFLLDGMDEKMDRAQNSRQIKIR